MFGQLARRSGRQSLVNMVQNMKRQMSSISLADAKIVYTHTDEAPMLATRSFLPVAQAFTKSSGVQIELRDISLAGRIICQFPERLTPEQRVADELTYLGELCKTPYANVIKLPNVSASGPQLQDCIAELQSQGYDIPNFPTDPSTPEEHDTAARYARVLGSAVNPVLREGNSDRRVAPPVKAYAQANPHGQKPWGENSQTHVAHMEHGDFYESEQSHIMQKAGTVRIEFEAADGEFTVLKESVSLLEGEVIDASFMDVDALQEYFAKEIKACKEQGILLSLHLKATMMKVSDPIMFGHACKVYFAHAFRQHGDLFEELGVNVNNGIEDVLIKIAGHPQEAAVLASIERCYEHGPDLAMVDSRKGITNLHVPNNVIIDASIPPVIRDGGCMWTKEDTLAQTKMLIPDRCYARQYSAIVEDCVKNGRFDVATMGNVSNVGLMAQKAEEYGSHDKTFEIPAAGQVRVVNNQTGEIHFTHNVGAGAIWRMCQTKDVPIKDWIKLAVSRARATGNPAIFWLDENRAHDRSIISLINKYLPEFDTEGLDISIMAPVDAMKATCARVRASKDTISVTGNVLRDYLTDLFPILELGTSAKMLSIVPLLQGGGLYETGAGGSAPKHVQQFQEEGHLRWDSLGEFLALAVSIEDLGIKADAPKARILADTLNQATGNLLNTGKSPLRKVGQLDNRGSHFYMAKYWAEALAEQTECPELAAEFSPVASKLASSETAVLAEIDATQGTPVDLGGYYNPDIAKMDASMRPSKTLNDILDSV